jgi:hypothetical protein
VDDLLVTSDCQKEINVRASSGYIPSDAAFRIHTFQVLGSRPKPGCAEQGVADGLADLVSRCIAR